MVRPHVDWMTRADDTILEFLRNGDNRALRVTPAVVEANVEYGISHVRTRLRRLHEAGLVEYYDGDRGIYEITSLGTTYLDGEIEAAALSAETN